MLPSPILLLLLTEGFWSVHSEAYSLGANPHLHGSTSCSDCGQVTSPVCAHIPHLCNSYGLRVLLPF